MGTEICRSSVQAAAAEAACRLVTPSRHGGAHGNKRGRSQPATQGEARRTDHIAVARVFKLQLQLQLQKLHAVFSRRLVVAVHDSWGRSQPATQGEADRSHMESSCMSSCLSPAGHRFDWILLCGGTPGNKGDAHSKKQNYEVQL